MKNRGLLLLMLLIVINMFYLHLREERILNETVSLAMGLCIGACWGAVLAYLSMKFGWAEKVYWMMTNQKKLLNDFTTRKG